MDSSNEIRSYWKEKAEGGLPAITSVHERNAAITTNYANLFLAKPSLFKWAGLAAFASRAVGDALIPYDFGLVAVEKLRASPKHTGLRVPESWLQEVELLRDANNKVYDDIAWAHLAYQSGWLPVLESALPGFANPKLILEGFKKIDQGRLALDEADRKKDPKQHVEAMDLIWQGNVKLLEHEQKYIVQPHFDDFDPAFDLVLSHLTTLSFGRSTFSLLARYRTFFALFMFLHGAMLLLSTMSWPLLKRMDHRWYWIVNSPLRLWKSFTEDDAAKLVSSTFPNAKGLALGAP